MTLRLQDFGFDKSEYERPTQKWICGWAPEDRACWIGPDTKGHCRATFECTPEKKGDRWVCLRPKSYGGPCEEGPFPDGTCSKPIPRCQPVRSLRAKRGIVMFWTSLFSFGLLFFFLAWPRRSTFVSPGDLSVQHHDNRVDDCAACHTAGQRSPTSWLNAAFASDTGVVESTLCLNCHSENLGDYALQAHSLPSQELVKMSEQAQQTFPALNGSVLLSLATLMFDIPQTENGELACATCHKEHRGRDVKLTDIVDQQCQICHIHKFSGFTEGHPEFSDLSILGLPNRIPFSHKHHKTIIEAREFVCTRCHIPDIAGQNMLVGKLADLCGTCHTQAEILRWEASPILIPYTLAHFSHTVHTRIPALHCESCHALSPDSTGDFVMTKKATCETCHTQRHAQYKAGDDCLTCHQYHATRNPGVS